VIRSETTSLLLMQEQVAGVCMRASPAQRDSRKRGMCRFHRRSVNRMRCVWLRAEQALVAR
jgi:hypothetical protein